MSPELQSPGFLQSKSLSDLSTGQAFYVGNLVHLYLELKLGLELDGNEAKEHSKRALNYIASAADAAFLTAEEFGGRVLEIQGKTLHLAFPYSIREDAVATIQDAAGCLHGLLLTVYRGGGPQGWKMAADFGVTIAIQCPGIHGDTSVVSLSPAANKPAKKLGVGDVALNELCYFNGYDWRTESLEVLLMRHGKARIEKSGLLHGSLKDRVMVRRAKVATYRSAAAISAQAAPISSPGGLAPTSNDPMSRFGIVVSMDLDGFSAAVLEASKSIELARRLAEDFYQIMMEAARFAKEHDFEFVQLPFAGDNAIFAVVAEDHRTYAKLKKVSAARVAVEWELRMGPLATKSRFGGWAHVTAGGEVPHGNSSGNLHIAKIQVDDREFIVAVGPGIRYSREGFTQVSPSPGTLAMFSDDLKDLDPLLRERFKPCKSFNGAASSNYQIARIDDIKRGFDKVRERDEAVRKFASVSVAMGSGRVLSSPFAGDCFLVKDHQGRTRKRLSPKREADYKPEVRHFIASLRKELPDLRLVMEKKGIVCMAATIRHESGETKIRIEMDGNPQGNPPKVFCDAPWIRREIDWHFVPPGCGHKRGHFCWVLAPEWEDYFHTGPGAGCPLEMRTQDAAIWLVSAMALMLDRHRVGTELGLMDWPETWLDYSHGAKGLREYRAGTHRNR